MFYTFTVSNQSSINFHMIVITFCCVPLISCKSLTFVFHFTKYRLCVCLKNKTHFKSDMFDIKPSTAHLYNLISAAALP